MKSRKFGRIEDEFFRRISSQSFCTYNISPYSVYIGMVSTQSVLTNWYTNLKPELVIV